MSRLPITILLVDDETDFVQMLSLRLREEGHVVRGVCSGEEALAELANFEPEVALLDLKMPGMDGITTLKAMKAACPEVEVVLLTGHGTADATSEGLEAGAFDYLIKPADFDELLDKLEAARSQRAEPQGRFRRDKASTSLGESDCT